MCCQNGKTIIIIIIIIMIYFTCCLKVTPCIGWLNNNATMRQLTTQRAQNLSRTMHDFAKANKHRWANMEINYMDCPITTGKTKTDTIIVS